MATVRMPKLSDSMLEGTIIRWLKGDGDPVEGGEELVEIETDKATVVYEAEHSGQLRILAGDGATLAVGAVIGDIGNGDLAARPRPKASPLARRLAQGLGVDLAPIAGSGPAGRIVKRDVEAAAGTRGAAASAPAEHPAAAASPASAPPTSAQPTPAPAASEELMGRVTRRPLSSSQATIARRMSLAKSTIPEFTLDTEVRMDAVLALRSGLSGTAREQRPSVTDFIVKACGLALREHPAVNAAWADGAVEHYGRVNVGVAVAAPDTLLVPTIFDADAKTLGQIAGESQDLARRAREGVLTPAQLSGATFTVSNLGMYGITSFTAVLNPPQAAILAAGAVVERVVLHDGAPAGEHRMTLTLTCDHRVIYGAAGAAFLQTVRQNLEEPLRLAL